MKYNVYTLDVWGNETDGYDINDFFTLDKDISIDSDDEFDAYLSTVLVGDISRYTILDEFNGFIEVSYEGKPILHFNVID